MYDIEFLFEYLNLDKGSHVRGLEHFVNMDYAFSLDAEKKSGYRIQILGKCVDIKDTALRS